jgi:hypothetical protein
MTLRDPNVARINVPTHVYVGAEVGAVGCLRIVLLNHADIARINVAACVHVANKDAHFRSGYIAGVAGRVHDAV